ncbi:MAG: hypothetical protein K2J48_06120, partial [Muribaculaceae bacterium]|nr:hypothetical protein [Muribaculaceae bacterium]
TWYDGMLFLNFNSDGVAELKANDIGWYYSTHPTNYPERSFLFSDEREGGVPSTYSFKIDDISIFKEAFEKLNNLK